MKKGLILLMAAAMSLSIAACGNKDDGNSNGSASETQSTATESVDNTENTPAPTPVQGTAIEGAGDEVDMKKVDGTELDGTDAEDATLSDSAKIGNFDVAIKDAKVIDYEDNKILVVSIDFKNGNSTPMSFNGIMSVDATQNGSELRPAVVVDVDGININSTIEEIPSGKTTTVQKTYVLNDESSDVNILVYKYGEPGGDAITKSFKLK